MNKKFSKTNSNEELANYEVKIYVTIRCLIARLVLPAILKLLACKDQPLLVRGDTLLVLDLGLHILDGVARLDL